jgi:hypothetical protein
MLNKCDDCLIHQTNKPLTGRKHEWGGDPDPGRVVLFWPPTLSPQNGRDRHV